MINTVQEILESVPTAERHLARRSLTQPASPNAPLVKILALPLAAVIAAAVHLWASRGQPALETQPFFLMLAGALFAGLLLGILQRFSSALCRWVQHMGPLLAGALFLLALWETLTSGLGLLPLPYFPGPAGVLRILVDERM